MIRVLLALGGLFVLMWPATGDGSTTVAVPAWLPPAVVVAGVWWVLTHWERP